MIPELHQVRTCDKELRTGWFLCPQIILEGPGIWVLAIDSLEPLFNNGPGELSVLNLQDISVSVVEVVSVIAAGVCTFIHWTDFIYTIAKRITKLQRYVAARVSTSPSRPRCTSAVSKRCPQV